MIRSKITVRVPATTSNLGPGFDSLGVALALYNRVTVRRDEGEEAKEAMFRQTGEAFFSYAKVKPFRFGCAIRGDVPRSRGLGSSVTVRLGITAALNRLCGDPLSSEEVLALVVKLEGHPDNAAPACYGGFAACGPRKVVHVPIRPKLKFIALIPGFTLETKKARALLPKKIDFADAVHNLQHTALITAAFCAEDYGALRGLFRDRLHQPYRAKLVPGFDAIIAAAEKAGALGCFLSGAGSTLMALALEKAESIGRAMQREGRRHGTDGEVILLKADNDGMRILD